MESIYDVRGTAHQVVEQASQVTICDPALETLAELVRDSDLERLTSASAFDTETHFFDGGPQTVQYLLVVDALNFCFWPAEDLEYEHLARGVKAAAMNNPGSLTASSLSQYTGADVQRLFDWQQPVPLLEERARLLREVGRGLQQYFNGQAANLVLAAHKSAASLITMLTTYFPGFQDHCIYRGRQIHLLKRAQIFVADVWGAFQGQSYGRFDDISELTMFADYRVPAALREFGVLEYAPSLAQRIDDRAELPAGSEEECEIRACTIVAVEKLRQALASETRKPNSIHLDWWLWEHGEQHRKDHRPHHRTLTIYY
ncbi:hypothetical protein WJX73_009457 [Symbiochloris irregularis]|uniref:Queuosine 5'-phosphate N-glycosylase/hydrolase n=1 Tax=Symbiochloris irregularis TaxID=706552 RepID=A0AAW1NV76_9CHLO